MNEERTDEQPPIRPPSSRWENADWVALCLLLLVAAVLRFASLSDPQSMIFDEVYYAKDSCFYILNSVDPCEVDGNQAEVHPPVGKWLIAAGIKAFGFDSLGWRIGPAVAGVITIALMYLLARRLFGSWIWAALAAGLLTLDPLHFVQSRTSMLDIFVPMFGLAMLLFLLYDRDRSPPGGILRPWRMAAGVAGGLALATKWTGGFFLALAIVLTFAWGVAARRAEERGGLVATIRGDLPSVVLWLVLLPVIVYIVSFAGQIGGSLLSWPWSDGSWGKGLIDHHRYMWNFHTTLLSTHGYQSPPWSWMLIKRPVSYFFCSGQSCTPPVGDNDYQEIFATGSPLIWWTSILALVGVAVTWVSKRDFRRPEGVILAGLLFTYGPWFLPGAERPAVFIFYLLPTVPFMILALVYWMERISETWEGKAATSLFTAGAVALFFFYLPLLTKKTLPQPVWQKRIWIFDNCDKPPGPTVTTTVTVTENGEERETTSETQDNSSLAPTGWCWI